LFSISEVNCQFIDIHPSLSSILNVFHKKYNVFYKYIIYATTTSINT
jgi:hypothetical protein